MTLNQALERTGKVLGEFCRCYKEQFGVALFNSVRYEIEGAGSPQAQLLHRKVPLEDHVIYSGNIFQYIEENKKWRNRFCVVPHNYGLVLYENKLAYEREQPPRVLVNSAGYKVLTSVEQYLELVNNSLPGEGPGGDFWVGLGVSDAVYRMVYELAKAQYDAAVARCEQERPQLESTIRTDMDQIITSKEHLASKIRAFVLPKAEVCVRNHVQPYISSILEALMTPTSQGFAEAREVFFKEVTDMNMNVVNEGGLEKLVEYMEKLSHLAFHPVKMQSCYEKMDQLKLEGLQQRFDVSSTSVFKQRAQIHMRQQMDDAVYTFETLLHQELSKLQGKDELCKSIQRILERVLKKFDYDSSTVRKKFFREALLQITIPFLLKKLAPTCKGELAKFQELIFEDFASFILVENTYEEVVLQSVMKDIMQAEVPSGAGTRRPAPAPPVPGAEVSSGGQCATPALSPVPGAEVPSGTGRRPAPASPVPRADVPAEAEVPPVTPRSSVPASPVSAADVPSGAEVPHVTPRSSMPASPVPRADVPSEAEVPHVTPRSSVPASPVPRADVPSVPSVPHGTAAPGSPRAGVPAEAEVSHVPAEAEVPLVTAAPPGGHSPSAVCHLHGDKEPGEPRGTTESGEGVQTEF
uniref:Niban 1/2/3 domain-containing protein n=1 Tax=Zonotrichia albicollis TaxID=44394 RepID=A0A8D2MHS3_ZONAL